MDVGVGVGGHALSLQWVQSSAFVYPLLEAAHIAGIGLLLGSLFVFELRVWGRGKDLDPVALARLALPVTVAGFGLAAATGLVMFASQAAELIANRAFLWKMILLTLAGLNAVWFHQRGALEAGDRLARLQTAVSLGLWLGVIICGRRIAYR